MTLSKQEESDETAERRQEPVQVHNSGVRNRLKEKAQKLQGSAELDQPHMQIIQIKESQRATEMKDEPGTSDSRRKKKGS